MEAKNALERAKLLISATRRLIQEGRADKALLESIVIQVECLLGQAERENHETT